MKLYFAIIVILSSTWQVFALQDSDFKDWYYYIITNDSYQGKYGPVIKVYYFSANTYKEYYRLPVDDSKLCEYIMARLINVRHNQKMHYEEKSGIKYYRFKYQPVTPTSTNEFGGIGFYEEADGTLVLEVFVNNDAFHNNTPELFRLKPDDSHLQKMKFDFIVSSLIGYFTFGYTDQRISVIDSSGINIGIKIAN